MNTETGIFEQEEEAPTWATTIEIGEVVKIKGEECRVTEIKRRSITLELMSRTDRQEMFDALDRASNRHERRAAEAALRKG